MARKFGWMIVLIAFLAGCAGVVAETSQEVSSASVQPVQPAPVQSGALQVLTPEIFDSKIAANEKFTVFMAIADCTVTPGYLKVLEKYVADNNLSEQVFYFGVVDEADIPLALRVIPRMKNGYAPSQIIAFEDGRFVDWNEADGNEINMFVENYFVRNRYTTGKSKLVKDYSEEKISAEDLSERIKHGRSSSNLSGLSLVSADLSMLSFSGSHFKQTNLKDANLEGASFAYADMTGADLTGANVKDVNWYYTVCPDGTRSETNTDRSCENNLVVKAVE